MSALLLVHTFATLALVGSIWTIQLVHYPLLRCVERGFTQYHEAHTSRIVWLVAPLMGLELLSALALASAPPAGVSSEVAWVGFALVVATWLSTGLVSVPCHSKLAGGFDAAVIDRLVSTNWLRTIAWTARGVLVLWMLERSARALA